MALKHIGADLSIERNDALETLSGFSVLNSVGGILRIGGFFSGNRNLRTLSGFDALSSIEGNLFIQGNAELFSCCGLLRLAQGNVRLGGSAFISRNATGCNTEEEIISICVGTLVISSDSDVPANASSLRRLTQSLFIRGTISTFPNFAALEVVEGNITISDISGNDINPHITDLNNIFPALDSILWKPYHPK